jgi:Leucine-rich repeat (LRR) protein
MSRGLTELEKLSEGIYGIRTIQLGAFNGLKQLTHLSMPYHDMRKIIPGTCEKMGHLEYLDLAFNKIEHLEVDAFTGLNNLIIYI